MIVIGAWVEVKVGTDDLSCFLEEISGLTTASITRTELPSMPPIGRREKPSKPCLSG
jgi:hypothetical protein